MIAELALLRCAAVVRFRLWLVTVVALSAILGTVLRAQVSDEEKRKREQFLKTRAVSSDSDESPSPTPKRKAKKSASKKASPTPKPKPKPKAKPSETPEAESQSRAIKENAEHRTPNAERPIEEKASSTPKATAKAKKKSTAKKSPTPTGKRKRKKASPAPEKTPKPEKTPTPQKAESTRAFPSPVERPTAPLPRAIPMPSPEERAQVVIEKSGFERDQGLAPTPSPPPRRFLFWPLASRSSAATNYRYLTRSIIEEIRRAPVQRRRWQFIVVHNSGTRQGNARVFDYYHRHVRRRHLSGRRFQSRSTDARPARMLRGTHPLSARALRQDRQSRHSGPAASRNESAPLGNRLSRRCVSVLVVQTVSVEVTSVTTLQELQG